MTKNRRSGLNSNPGCSVEATLSLIDGKWKCVILFYLLNSTVVLTSCVDSSQILPREC